jgi:predicted enzyme related to lactoylglutathione lyase
MPPAPKKRITAMPANFFWYELMTTDVAAAENFYTNVVGWTAAPFDGSAMPYIVFSAGDRSAAGLMLLPEEAKAMGAPPSWIGYIHASDVDAATESLRKAGGTVHRAPQDIPTVGRFSVVADPEGAAFMLMTPSGPDQPPVASTTPGHVGWHELYAADHETAFDFYAGQFGWTKQRDFDMGEMGNYLIYSAGGGEDSGGHDGPPQRPAGPRSGSSISPCRTSIPPRCASPTMAGRSLSARWRFPAAAGSSTRRTRRARISHSSRQRSSRCSAKS